MPPRTARLSRFGSRLAGAHAPGFLQPPRATAPDRRIITPTCAGKRRSSTPWLLACQQGILIGNLGADPKLRYPPTARRLPFRIATNESYKGRDGTCRETRVAQPRGVGPPRGDLRGVLKRPPRLRRGLAPDAAWRTGRNPRYTRSEGAGDADAREPDARAARTARRVDQSAPRTGATWAAAGLRRRRGNGG